jgi:hypothetical protein
VKCFSDSGVSLDIAPLSARVKLTFHSLMLRVQTKLSASSVLFSLEVLALGLFINGAFSWSARYLPPLPTAAPQIDVRSALFGSPTKSDGAFVLERYGEPTPRSGDFVTARQYAEVSLRSVSVAPLFVGIILAPKVSRYISKSVLNI